MVSTKELIEKLKVVSLVQGYQVSIRRGILNFTKAIYLKDSRIYLFAMEDEFSFEETNGDAVQEFLSAYDGVYWLIEDTIN